MWTLGNKKYITGKNERKYKLGIKDVRGEGGRKNDWYTLEEV